MLGTSMAAAHVSGVAALVDSLYGGALTADQIVQILKQSADDLGKPGKDMWYGFGRINAFRAATGK
jgi:subtilisin family serine protease